MLHENRGSKKQLYTVHGYAHKPYKLVQKREMKTTADEKRHNSNL